MRYGWARTFRQGNGPMLRRAAARARAPHGQTLDAGEEAPPHAAVGPRPAYRQAALSTDRAPAPARALRHSLLPTRRATTDTTVARAATRA